MIVTHIWLRNAWIANLNADSAMLQRGYNAVWHAWIPVGNTQDANAAE